MSGPWTQALAEIANRLNRGRIDWLLVGSAATALRGVAINPGDIDVSVATAEDIVRAAKLLPTPDSLHSEEQPHQPNDPATWISTTAEPTLRFGNTSKWTFGRWLVNGVKVELAHIDDPATAHLMIETRGPLIWSERSVVEWHEHRVPTVPIEVQLATMIARQQETRINATITAISRRHLNVSLLRRAIADRQSEGFALNIPEQLQHLLDEQSARSQDAAAT